MRNKKYKILVPHWEIEFDEHDYEYDEYCDYDADAENRYGKRRYILYPTCATVDPNWCNSDYQSVGGFGMAGYATISFYDGEIDNIHIEYMDLNGEELDDDFDASDIIYTNWECEYEEEWRDD